MTDRKGDWIQTSTGIAFYVTDPRAEEVSPHDIAHGLAAEARFNGHTPEGPYSVGQHSVLVSHRVEELATALGMPTSSVKALAFAGLLHDASEAYCKDIPRPLKRDLANYEEIEMRIQVEVFKRFCALGLLDDRGGLPTIVKQADNEILAVEAEVLQPAYTRPRPWNLRADAPEGWGWRLAVHPWTFHAARQVWLSRFAALDGWERDVAFFDKGGKF